MTECFPIHTYSSNDQLFSYSVTKTLLGTVIKSRKQLTKDAFRKSAKGKTGIIVRCQAKRSNYSATGYYNAVLGHWYNGISTDLFFFQREARTHVKILIHTTTFWKKQTN